MNPTRRAFSVSDRTGITADNVCTALLEQFKDINIRQYMRPFIDNADKANALVEEIQSYAEKDGVRPIVFSSISDPLVSKIVHTAPALHLSFFDAFLEPLEQEFGISAQHVTQSRLHNVERYDARMDAVNFALSHDDANTTSANMQDADVILVGVSRSGKTPTCLYLAMQYGIRAANYPLTEEDLNEPERLPAMIKAHQKKLFGLTIKPERLSNIREERYANSDYATLARCQHEIATAQSMFRRFRIPHANTTHKSIEELAAYIIQECKLKRRC